MKTASRPRLFRVAGGFVGDQKFFRVLLASEPLGSDALGLEPAARLFVPGASGKLRCGCPVCGGRSVSDEGAHCAWAAALLAYLLRWWGWYGAWESN